MKNTNKRDQAYLDVILTPIRVCALYKPKLGQGSKAGLSLEDFQKTYQSDPFYTWFGLDHPLMYAAHKVSGGMTSVYRQIGIGVESLFQVILQDELGLTEEEIKWSYHVTGSNGKVRKLSLDARILLDAINDMPRRKIIVNWMAEVCSALGVESSISKCLKGIVFEVRQGYKSKDSKRQNADISNAATAYTQAYLPCAVIMSRQIDMDLLHRYHSEKWVILTGQVDSDSPLDSTYAFMSEVVGYNLADFFNRHSRLLKKEVEKVLEALLRAD